MYGSARDAMRAEGETTASPDSDTAGGAQVATRSRNDMTEEQQDAIREADRVMRERHQARLERQAEERERVERERAEREERKAKTLATPGRRRLDTWQRATEAERAEWRARHEQSETPPDHDSGGLESGMAGQPDDDAGDLPPSAIVPQIPPLTARRRKARRRTQTRRLRRRGRRRRGLRGRAT